VRPEGGRNKVAGVSSDAGKVSWWFYALRLLFLFTSARLAFRRLRNLSLSGSRSRGLGRRLYCLRGLAFLLRAPWSTPSKRPSAVLAFIRNSQPFVPILDFHIQCGARRLRVGVGKRKRAGQGLWAAPSPDACDAPAPRRTACREGICILHATLQHPMRGKLRRCASYLSGAAPRLGTAIARQSTSAS